MDFPQKRSFADSFFIEDGDSMPTAMGGFMLIGTALPNANDPNDHAKFVPVWKQEARDERGRKRFHGAFTGGFSAGYFNTVGSREGWTPAQFVSSRQARHPAPESTALEKSRIQDFMDEEDWQDWAGGEVVATTTTTTDTDAAVKQSIAQNTADFGALGALPESLIENLVIPTQDSTGIRLLKLWGWKQGQGVGPRVKKKATVSFVDDDDTPITATTAATAADNNDDDQEEFIPSYLSNVTFAPKNIALYQPSNNPQRKGLGFITSLSADVDLNRYLSSQQRESNQSGGTGGIGVGVLQEDGEEDQEIYQPNRLNRAHYNDILWDDEETPPVFRKPLVKTTTTTTSASASKSYQVCLDGRPPLTGFQLSSAPLQPFMQAKIIELNLETLTIPDDWEPKHVFTRPGPRPPRLLVAAAKESISALATAPPPMRSLGPAPNNQAPVLDVNVAQAALNNNFAPFASNPAKQERYRQFLLYQTGDSSTLPVIPGWNDQQQYQEWNEFTQAARIFRPISGDMALRFTSSSTSSTQDHTAGVGIKAVGGDKTEKPEKVEPPSKDSRVQAARMGLYGAMTRSVRDWQPERILCKRFNIAIRKS